ncbi:MAG TPA: hypothetical protein ENN67_01400, partial [Firmicutes bacterium]|nr:hypothetical protein [Bacillota bacterium]
MPDLPHINTSDSELASTANKIFSGERLSFEDGLVLEKTNDTKTVLQLGHFVRNRMHGLNTSYIVNVH